MNTFLELKALLFSSDNAEADTIYIPTYFNRHNPTIRYPFLDPILDATPLSTVPIRRSIVFLADEHNVIAKFIIIFKHEPGRGENVCLKYVEDSVVWEGELVVMLGGSNFNIISLSDPDSRTLAHTAVKKFLLACRDEIASANNQGRSINFPRSIRRSIA